MQHMAISNQYHVIFRDSIKPVTDVDSSVTKRISLHRSPDLGVVSDACTVALAF